MPRFTWLLASALLLAGCAPDPESQSYTEQSQKDEVGPLYGVITEFTISPTEIKHADVITVTLKMTNKTAEPIKFRYSGCIEQHVDLFDSQGLVVFLKNGAPVLECPYFEVEIKPGETIEQPAPFHFGTYYSAKPGTYRIGFRYDRRFMERSFKGDYPWIPWGNVRLKLTVNDGPPGK